MTSLTLSNLPATFVPDGTEGCITKGLNDCLATIVNGGMVDFWMRVNHDTVACTGAQTDPTAATPDWEVCVPAGASFPVLAHYKTMYVKTAGTAALAYWVPQHRIY